MSDLPTLIWSPSTVLNIITASNDISCAGITKKGLPCGWELGGDSKSQTRRLLASMSQRSPREAIDVLPQLARLCLCQKNNQQQAASVVARWTAIIEPYASSLERVDTQHTHRSNGSSTSSMSCNSASHASGSNRPKFNYNEIIAQLKALTIRREELISMLQDAPSANESARTSPSQDTPRQVNQSQLSELESPRAGHAERRRSPSSGASWMHVFKRGKPLN